MRNKAYLSSNNGEIFIKMLAATRISIRVMIIYRNVAHAKRFMAGTSWEMKST